MSVRSGVFRCNKRAHGHWPQAVDVLSMQSAPAIVVPNRARCPVVVPSLSTLCRRLCFMPFVCLVFLRCASCTQCVLVYIDAWCLWWCVQGYGSMDTAARVHVVWTMLFCSEQPAVLTCPGKTRCECITLLVEPEHSSILSKRPFKELAPLASIALALTGAFHCVVLQLPRAGGVSEQCIQL